MTCPNCHMNNHESTQRCDCGYDFLTKLMNQPDPEDRQGPPEAPTSQIPLILTGVFFIIAALITYYYAALDAFGPKNYNNLGNIGTGFLISGGSILWKVITFEDNREYKSKFKKFRKK